MSYQYEHSSVYIVRIVDTTTAGEVRTWFVGPYGSTRAGQTAGHIENSVADLARLQSRECFVEPLFSDDECLRVADYGRAAHGSLR